MEVGGLRYPTLTYTRPAGADARLDVTYTGEKSTTLAPLTWSSLGMIIHSTTPAPGGLTEKVILRSTVPIGSPGVTDEFLHLKISL